MKLRDIIYVNEGARTPAESLEKGVAAIRTNTSVVLISKERALQAFANKEAKMGKPSFLAPGEDPTSTSNQEEFYYWRTAIETDLSKRAVVGAVSFDAERQDLFQVGVSAGVSKFGPLAYQIAMNAISPKWSSIPAWLKSDTSLRPDSLKVWQTMYTLSEQGIYERKWLGDWSWSYIPQCVDTWGSTMVDDHKTYAYLYEWVKIAHQKKQTTEADFLDYLKTNPRKGGVGAFEYDKTTDPSMFGNFWAYRKTSQDPKVDDMFELGNQLAAEVKEKYHVPEDLVKTIFRGAGMKFFSRRYHS